MLTLQITMNHHNVSEQMKTRVPMDEWTNVMLKYNSSIGMQVFVNGKKQRITFSTQPEMRDVTTNFVLGRFPISVSSNSAFSQSEVSVDNIAVWDRRLTDQEIETIYLGELGTHILIVFL